MNATWYAAGMKGLVAKRVTALEKAAQERLSNIEAVTGDEPSRKMASSRYPSRSTLLSNIFSNAQEKARKWGEQVAL